MTDVFYQNQTVSCEVKSCGCFLLCSPYRWPWLLPPLCTGAREASTALYRPRRKVVPGTSAAVRDSLDLFLPLGLPPALWAETQGNQAQAHSWAPLKQQPRAVRQGGPRNYSCLLSVPTARSDVPEKPRSGFSSCQRGFSSL